MQQFIAFIKSKQFFTHLFLIIVLICLVIFGTLAWLSSYTNHGKYVVVPDFKDQKVSTLDEFIKDKNISYEIIDSIYDPKEKTGIVLRQDPDVNVQVKHNRTVYLYVTGMVAPKIAMPKLIDRSERQARLIINSYGLKVGAITEKTADCNGCVLSQLYQGKEIEPGTPVKKGSVIELVVGIKDSYFHANPGDSVLTENEELNFE